jgi:hypothetical protein
MRCQFSTQHPLHQPDLQILHQAVFAKQLLDGVQNADNMLGEHTRELLSNLVFAA